MATTFCAPASGDPAAWVGCLACYNEGKLVGDWFPAVDADAVTTSDLHGTLTRDDSHDELWVFDHENIPVGEEMSPADAVEWGLKLTSVSENERLAFCAWVREGDYVTDGKGDLPSVSDFEERYCGRWDSFGDYAFYLAEEIGLLSNVAEEVARYFDWKSWSRDLKFDYSTCAADRGIYVFRSL